MPLLFNQNINGNQLALWSIEETIEQLEEMAGHLLNGEPQYHQINSQGRKKEWLSVRLLAQRVLGEWPKLDHKPSGKPFLVGSKLNISISHTSNMAGILIGDHEPLGIDIESSSRNIDKIIKRFLSKTEYNEVKDAPNAVKMAYWCVKEAVFKALDQSSVEFSSQIIVKKIIENTPYNKIESEFVSSGQVKQIKLYSFIIQGNIIVWTR